MPGTINLHVSGLFKMSFNIEKLFDASYYLKARYKTHPAKLANFLF